MTRKSTFYRHAPNCGDLGIGMPVHKYRGRIETERRTQRFIGEQSFEISIPASFSLSVARFSMSVVTHGPDTVQSVVWTLAHRFLQNA
jgi:hypothetical protein